LTTALLLVDIQNDYFPGGPMALSGMTDAAAKAADLLAVFREKSLPIFHVRHLSLGDDAGFLSPVPRAAKSTAR
jgi:nicotinamidase-related amidase